MEVIHWTLFYKPHSWYRQWGVSDSAMKKIIEWGRALSEGFAEKWIYFHDVAIQQEKSKQFLPKKYNKVTLIVDGWYTC